MKIKTVVDYRDLVIVFLIEHKIISLLLILGIILILSSIIWDKKVTLIRRKYNVRKRKLFSYFHSYIENIDFIKTKRDALAFDLALISHKNNETNKLYANNIISSFIVAMIIIISSMLILIKNIILKILIPICIIVIVPGIFYNILESKRKKAKNDFKEVVSVYTSKYSFYLNTKKSFEKSIKEIPSSHKYEFSRLIKAINTKDYDKALDEYALRINDNFCYTFAEIIKASFFDNSGTIKALIKLEDAIGSDRISELDKLNKSGKNKMNIYFLIGCIVLFIYIDYKLLGDFVITFFTNTFIGQICITFTLIAVLVVFILTQIFDKL